MRPQTALSSNAPIVQALARGVCPICTLMRAFQNAMIKAPLRFPTRTICNFHVWSLAGSSPSVEAARIFRSMLEEAVVSPTSKVLEMHPCDWCATLRDHEDEKLAEFARELQHDNFRSWIMQYGTVCVFHDQRLIRVLSADNAELIRRVLATNMQDLEKQLEAFDVKVRRGDRGRAGVPGFIAEFLVSQRGITR